MTHQFFFNPYILDNLAVPARGFDVVQDVSEPRLRMYITSRGVKTFFVRKRVHGRDRRIIIGKYPDVDIEEARSAVATALEDASKKIQMKRKKISFHDFVQMYLKNCVHRSVGSYDKLVRSIDRHLKNLFNKNVSDITSDDIRETINGIDGAAMAERMHELLQSIFRYAIGTGYVKENPVLQLPKPEQNRRVRPLNKHGLRRLVDAIKNYPDSVMRDAFLMLVYGFATKNQVFSMQWADMDFNRDTWNEKPLSDIAVVLLQDMPQDGYWVFPGRGHGHLTDPRLAWSRVIKEAGIPNLTMDDVYKFMMRHLVWAGDREDLRANMNNLLEELFIIE
ncbi:MAG: integrase arm-type DNA-binding domain-containing protein [Alphaproteobacteria bacterium]|nr:integrase arm-type DNA-binding domain-containing protein [Alphaproteobacteria bacterium]